MGINNSNRRLKLLLMMLCDLANIQLSIES
jgi:hypothetical protein